MSEFEIKFHLNVRECDIPVEGNVLASGDDSIDKKAETDVILALQDGNVWAWADVEVVAYIEGVSDLSASAYLSSVSCEDEKDFIENSGYYEDLCQEAKDDLMGKLSIYAKAYEALTSDQS